MVNLKLRKAYRAVSGISLGLLPFIFGIILSAAIYQSMPNLIGYIIISIIFILFIFLGFKIYRRIQIVGTEEFMSTPMVSPELDNLIPDEDGDTKLYSPKEFAEMHEQNIVDFPGGSLRVFGDWIGESYVHFHKITNIDFNDEKDTLTIEFETAEKLEVVSPKHILVGKTMMRVLQANSVSFFWNKDLKTFQPIQDFEIKYFIQQRKILYTSTEPKKRGYFDVSKSASALAIYGWFE